MAGVVVHRIFVRGRREYRRLQPDELGVEGAWIPLERPRRRGEDPWGLWS